MKKMISPIVEYKPKRHTLWSGKYKIPWDDRGFSERMLTMHLSQDHDMASRREKLIEQHVQWIQRRILKNKKSRILDVGCGPGLYVKKLTDLGHECRGIDFSPASIEYARQNCKEASFLLEDMREADYGNDFDVALLLFGEINVFSPQECKIIMDKLYSCLKPGGEILIEAHLFEAVKRMGQAPKSWFRSGGKCLDPTHWVDSVMNDGLFSENPHIALVENNWLEEERVALTNFWILEEAKPVSHYVSTTQAYSDQEYRTLFEGARFRNMAMHNAYGEPLTESSNFQVLTAVK